MDTPTPYTLADGGVQRIPALTREKASGRARELLDELPSRGGEPGLMVRTMAQAPALLRSYLDVNRAMKRSQQVIVGPAELTDADVDELRSFGYSDEQIAEVPALVALNVVTGAFNLVAGIHPSTTARSAA